MRSVRLLKLLLLLAAYVGWAGDISAQDDESNDSESMPALILTSGDDPWLVNKQTRHSDAGSVLQDAAELDPVPPDDRSVLSNSALSNEDASAPPQQSILSEVFPLFTGDPSLAFVPPVSEAPCTYGSVVSLDYDSFRGVPDGGWANTGIRTGINFATSLGQFSEVTGIGLQVGASVGVYDWGGSDYRMQNQNKSESQGFLTYGFFRKPTESSRITAGVVQDWSFNDTYGVFGQNPVLSQVRGQLGYAFSASNEFGIMGAAHVTSATRNIHGYGPTTWQSINQLSAYWHHKWFASGPDTWITAGAPAPNRLAGGGSVGDYLVSATVNAPLSDAVSAFSSLTYMHQSSSPGPTGSRDEAWNFIVGIAIYPGRNARSRTVAGQRWMPLIPVANNGSFLVDTNNVY